MKRKPTRLSRRYQVVLHQHLQQGPRAGLEPARGLGLRAAALGLETLDLARMHEAAVASLPPSRNRARLIQRATTFFAEAITPIEKTHRAAVQAIARFNRLSRTLGRRTTDVVASNRLLHQGVVRRQTAEKALNKSTDRHTRLMTESRRLQKRLRQLAHQILTAQEAERKKISRELHDEVAQTLLGIHVRLLGLRQESARNTASLKKEIANTQRLVGKSVKTMRRFAREIGQRNGT